MNNEIGYLLLLKKILSDDKEGRVGRNGKVYSIFGPQLEFDLMNEVGDVVLPLLTTKKMFLRGIFEELMFFIRGQTNTKILEEKGISIWKGNTSREFLDSRELFDYPEGDMGPMYGFVLRCFGEEYKTCNDYYEGYDQLYNLVKSLSEDPNSRRHLMTTFDPSSVDKCVLAPCHGIAIQFYVDGGCLSCKMYQRSADMFLGVPYNIASYGLLSILLAYILDLKPKKLIVTFGDVHIYDDHLDAVKEQLSREDYVYSFPKLNIKKQCDVKGIKNMLFFLERLEFSDIELVDYKSHPVIKAKMIA